MKKIIILVTQLFRYLIKPLSLSINTEKQRHHQPLTFESNESTSLIPDLSVFFFQIHE